MTQFIKKIADAKVVGPHPDFEPYDILYSNKFKLGFIDPKFDTSILTHLYDKLYRQVRDEQLTVDYLRDQKLRASSQFSFIVRKSNTLNFARVLDVGVSAGSLLKEFESIAELYGFEPDITMHQEAVKRLPAAKIYNTLFNEHSLPKGITLDLIALSHVFEHMSDPVSHLKTVLSMLAQDGLLFIEVPYDDVRHVRQIVKNRFSGLFHLFFYQPESLQLVVAQAGGEIIALETYGPGIDQHSYGKPFKEAPYIRVINKIGSSKLTKVIETEESEDYFNDAYEKNLSRGISIRALVRKIKS